MEVILRQSVEKLGSPGDVVKVSNGYARNYLLPRGIAVIALSPGIVATEMLSTAFDGNVSGYPSPDDIVPRWLKLLRSIEPGWNGRSLNLDDF